MGIAYFPNKGAKKIKAVEYSITEFGLNFSTDIPQLDKLVDHGFLRKLEIEQEPSRGLPSTTSKTYEQWEANPSATGYIEPTAEELAAAAEDTKKLLNPQLAITEPSTQELIVEPVITPEELKVDVVIDPSADNEAIAPIVTAEEVKAEGSIEEVKTLEAPKSRKLRQEKSK